MEKKVIGENWKKRSQNTIVRSIIFLESPVVSFKASILRKWEVNIGLHQFQSHTSNEWLCNERAFAIYNISGCGEIGLIILL